MTLYHGSNVEVNDLKLIPTKRLLDFEAGFYLTSDFEQAKKWALRTTSNRKIGTPLVSVYEVDDEMAEKVRVLIFEATNKEWLRYIAANRTGKLLDEEYDIVIGPVANDQTIRTINNYLKGYFPEDVAIRLLLPQKLKDQYAFRTERALKLLKFVEAKNV
ncbi:DUF3990 domain-containing protein [Bariatricus sp. HCP28S3_A7]|uniref:DUF3990 domain-containing protein n=1 Tax=Bariatricus sp. HCP28S3_A7 TaxID=3438894 RepID=UPI003F8C2300